MKGKIVLDDESLTVTASRFVEYLKEVKRKCGVKPIPVGSDSEKSSPQSQNRVPAHVEVTSSTEVAILFQLFFIFIISEKPPTQQNSQQKHN